MMENNLELIKQRGLELGKKLLEEVKKENLAVTKEVESWAMKCGERIAYRENEVEKARQDSDKFLYKKNREALERLSFEGAELSEIADIIKDKTVLEVLKKGAKSVLGFVLTSLIAFG